MTENNSQAHGRLAYLQIPAIDISQSAGFYEKVFGWNVEHAPSFEAPDLIGQWVTDRGSVAEGGMLAWFNVDHIEDTLDLVRSLGGEVLEPPAADGAQRMLATIRDPGGNVIGVAQHRPR